MKELKIDLREMNRWFRERFPNKDLITFEDFLSDYEELIFDKERLEETIKNLEENIEENYIQIPKNIQYNISDKDFI